MNFESTLCMLTEVWGIAVRAENDNNIAKYLSNLQMHKRHHTTERNTQAVATASKRNCLNMHITYAQRWATASKSRHHSSATQAVDNR